MVDIVVKSFLGACGAGVLTILVLLIKFIHQNIVNNALTLKALAHDAFFRYCRYLDGFDTLTADQLDNLNYLYAGYKAQKLNHTGDALYEKMCKKPVEVGE